MDNCKSAPQYDALKQETNKGESTRDGFMNSNLLSVSDDSFKTAKLFENSIQDARDWNTPDMENSTKDTSRKWNQFSIENSTNNNEHWDHGWAWVVAIAASICNFLFTGLSKSMGIILNEVVEKFEYPPAYSITMILSMGFALPCFFLASYLTTRFKVRNLVLLGGGLCFISKLVAAFAPSLGVLYTGMVLGGIGGSLVMPPSYIIINQYFKEKRSKGFAVATIGAGIGSFALAPIFGVLFDFYGYTGALMIVAALLAHILVAGALMRPPPITSDTTQERPEVDVIQDGGQTPEVDVTLDGGQEPKIDEKTPLVKKKLSRLQLLKNGTFLLYLFSLAACVLPAVPVYIPALALELGMPTRSSSLIISISGLGDILGRITSGFLFHRIASGRKRLYHSIVGIIIGVLAIGFGLVNSGAALCILAFVHGFSEAMFNAQRTAVPFEFVPTQSMEKAVGIILVSEFLGIILGAIMQGILAQVFGTYAVGFIIGGSVCSLVSLLMLVDFFRLKMCTRK